VSGRLSLEASLEYEEEGRADPPLYIGVLRKAERPPRQGCFWATRNFPMTETFYDEL
jgi:hypothetical protein